jgi:DNA helicase-2/ATP-dependent DNA helicase PcrA
MYGSHGARPSTPTAFDRMTRWPPSPRAAEQERIAQYRAGQRVRHPTFGEGIVIESKLQRDDEEVAVVFEELGIKRLLASIARLEMLSQD